MRKIRKKLGLTILFLLAAISLSACESYGNSEAEPKKIKFIAK